MDEFQQEIGRFYGFWLLLMKQGNLEKYKDIAIIDVIT